MALRTFLLWGTAGAPSFSSLTGVVLFSRVSFGFFGSKWHCGFLLVWLPEVCKSEAERFAFMQKVMVSELQGEGSCFVILGLHVILWMSIVPLFVLWFFGFYVFVV